MRTGKELREAYVEFGSEADTYDRNYRLDAGRYPDHVYRLRIFEDLLTKIKPTTVLDAGCGSGVPLVTFLKAGYDAYGFDRSPEMVEETQKRVKNSGFEETRVFHGDLDTFERPIAKPFDVACGLGAVYYTPNTVATLRHIATHVKDDGDLIFSLRNELFSLCSQNEYSADYLLRNIFSIANTSGKLRDDVLAFFAERYPKMNVAKLFENVDERAIKSHLHNPVTVQQDLLAPSGLRLEGLYYYHFHALPPIFEHTHQSEFYDLSAQCEDPTDWRGVVMASCFVVHAKKI
jgi:SAM-dependent methyltransferase